MFGTLAAPAYTRTTETGFVLLGCTLDHATTITHVEIDQQAHASGVRLSDHHRLA